jgi:hypothetical protein
VTDRPLATIRSYDELIEALRARAREMGATYDAIDQVAGLPTRYTSKALALGSRRQRGSPLSAQAMWPMMEALGIEVVIRERPDALERYENRVSGGNLSYMLNGAQNKPVILKFSRRRMKELGKLSGETRRLTVPKRTRSRIARQAAKARWRKPQITEITPDAVNPSGTQAGTDENPSKTR